MSLLYPCKKKISKIKIKKTPLKKKRSLNPPSPVNPTNRSPHKPRMSEGTAQQKQHHHQDQDTEDTEDTDDTDNTDTDNTYSSSSSSSSDNDTTDTTDNTTDNENKEKDKGKEKEKDKDKDKEKNKGKDKGKERGTGLRVSDDAIEMMIRIVGDEGLGMSYFSRSLFVFLICFISYFDLILIDTAFLLFLVVLFQCKRDPGKTTRLFHRQPKTSKQEQHKQDKQQEYQIRLIHMTLLQPYFIC